MSNYDMSDTACRERAEAARRLDKLDVAIKILADTCEDLLDRQTKLTDALKTLQDMVNINHAMIKEIQQCSKQE
jgi:prefoldin subunit 5